MSAASDPAPRAKSSKESRPSGNRRTLFLPMFILLLGLGALESYQVLSMEDRTDEMIQTIDKMDPQVKAAQYERTKFFKLASGVLRLAPHDANAAQVASDYKLKEIQVEQPELLNMDNASDIAASASGATTNAAPATNAPATNAPAKASP